jgi:hypothetical protein
MRYLKIGKSLNKKKLRKIIKHRKKMVLLEPPPNPLREGENGETVQMTLQVLRKNICGLYWQLQAASKIETLLFSVL